MSNLLARLAEYVDEVLEAFMQTELGRNAWPRYADRLRDAGDALKRECANAPRCTEPQHDSGLSLNAVAAYATACGDCDPCLGGRPDQCAVMSNAPVSGGTPSAQVAGSALCTVCGKPLPENDICECEMFQGPNSMLGVRTSTEASHQP
jgi:hypothetical protein